MTRFEFVRVATLRAAQLMRGCTARVPARAKAVVTARWEVAGGYVQPLPRDEPMPGLPEKKTSR
jgi:DNA-directed RNA polymerase subunit K/omega